MFLLYLYNKIYITHVTVENTDLSWTNYFTSQSLKNPYINSLPLLQVLDRTDGKLVHLDGLNFSRAWALFNIADKIADQDMVNIADKLADQDMVNIADKLAD